jgi:hypothetical protein
VNVKCVVSCPTVNRLSKLMEVFTKGEMPGSVNSQNYSARSANADLCSRNMQRVAPQIPVFRTVFDSASKPHEYARSK